MRVPINKGQFTLDTAERAALFEKNRGFGCEREYAENRRQWSEYPRSGHVADYPLHVDVELASICNLRCPMCYTISDEFRKKVNAKIMDVDLFKRVVDECAAGGTYSIRLSFRGEAFLHPRIVDCVRHAKAAGIREVSTLTNGVRIDERMFTEMMEAGIDWITFSVDGIGEIYENIRRPAKFDELVAKLRAFKQIKETAGTVKPVIKVQGVLPAIEHDADAYYAIFSEISDLVSANPLIDFTRSKVDLPKIPDFSCPQIYQRLVVGADGLCMMCANDESGDLIVGDANRQTIHEIWHGPEMSRVRDLHARHLACAQLTACANCYLPLQTFTDEVRVGARSVAAEKYVNGAQSMRELDIPARGRRDGLSV